MVSAPSERATLATIGAPPVPGDEDHVGPLEDLLDLLPVILGGMRPDFGIGSGPEATGEFPADVQLDIRVAHQECLRVGVDRDELNAFESLFDHPVHGVDAAPTDTDDLDDRQIVLRCCHEEGPFRSFASVAFLHTAFFAGESALSWKPPPKPLFQQHRLSIRRLSAWPKIAPN
jgi:hypothetical protein